MFKLGLLGNNVKVSYFGGLGYATTIWGKNPCRCAELLYNGILCMLLKSDFCCLELLEDFEIYLMMYIGPPKYQGLGMHIQLCTHPVLATNTELNSLLMGRLLTT